MENELKDKDLEQVSGGASWDEQVRRKPTWDEPSKPVVRPVDPEDEEIQMTCKIRNCQLNKEECLAYQYHPESCNKK